VLGALAVVIVHDAVVFRLATQVSGHLNAVQLALDGPADLGVIHLLQSLTLMPSEVTQNRWC
jgi:hypothetical protein